jgi:hypothetical protein
VCDKGREGGPLRGGANVVLNKDFIRGASQLCATAE